MGSMAEAIQLARELLEAVRELTSELRRAREARTLTNRQGD